jgi:hypothetical protein
VRIFHATRAILLASATITLLSLSTPRVDLRFNFAHLLVSDDQEVRSEIPLTNFRGIELRDFPAEIARLALVIAEYQSDVHYRGQKLALAEFLPLRSDNWITCGNALRLDWLSICPPAGFAVKLQADDLFSSPLDQAQIDFENEGGETYICGNPPYIWANNQTAEQKQEIVELQRNFGSQFRGLDYVSGWFFKYAVYSRATNSDAAFVATNSITQGEQVDPMWGGIIADGCAISFAHRSFKWQNLAKSNAGVSVVIVGLTRIAGRQRQLFYSDECIHTANISPYLLPMENIWMRPTSEPINGLKPLIYGSKPVCGGGLILSLDEAREFEGLEPGISPYLKFFIGSDEITSGKLRKCLWIEDNQLTAAESLLDPAHNLRDNLRLISV